MPLPAPTFNGLYLFGPIVQTNTFVLPRAAQRVGIAGADGLAHLDLGFRGAQTDIRGMLTGSSAPALQSQVLLAQSYRDGRAYLFVDGYGNLWPYSLLDDFRPDPAGGIDQKWGFWRRCSATILHLVYPS